MFICEYIVGNSVPPTRYLGTSEDSAGYPYIIVSLWRHLRRIPFDWNGRTCSESHFPGSVS